MKNIWNWIKDNPIRFMFLIPILLVAVISISHVVSWYDLANPLSWAVYLSIAIEVGAMVALVAATNKIKGGVWFMFGLVTFIQMVGNIFFSFKEVDTDGYLFKSWIELTAPVWEVLGSDPADLTAMKRWLAFLEGGLLPIISLTSLHFFVKFDDNKPKVEIKEEPKIEGPSDDEDYDGGLMSDSVINPIYEITKEIYENKVEPIVFDEITGEIELPEKLSPLVWEKEPVLTKDLSTYKKTPEIETFVSEEEYLDLQESRLSVNEPVNDAVNDTVNDTVNEGVNEGVNEIIPVQEMEFPDGTGILSSMDEVYTEETTETINDDIRIILEEIGDEVYTTTTTTLYDEYVKRLSYVKQS